MKGYSNPTIRTTEEGEIVGPKMHSALFSVAYNGAFSSRNALAKKVGPHGSQDYGYRIVNRCISKRLLALDEGHPEATPHGAGAVVLTDKGARYLNEHTDKDLDVSDYPDYRGTGTEDGWELKYLLEDEPPIEV